MIKMNKHLIVLGIAVLLICVGLSGCTEQTAIEKEMNEEDVIDSEDIIEKNYFTLSGNITNNYDDDIDIDFIVSAEYYTDWYYSTVDADASIHLSPSEVKEYSCEVKKGYEKYFFLISWYYQNGEQGYFTDINFTNSNYDDIIYHVEVKSNKEMEISKTYHPPNPNKAPLSEANADVTKGIPPLIVMFSGLGTDDDGNITGYQWDFGDGEISFEQNPTHNFQQVGTYIVRLTVTDDRGSTGSDTIVIKVESLAIIDYTAFDESYDWVRIVGLVKNFGNTNVKEVEIKVTLYNAEGSVIGFDNVYTHTAGEYSGILKPQETTGYLIRFSNMPDFNHCEAEITSYSTTTEQPYRDNLEILDVHVEPRDGYSYISGIVRNLGTKDVSSVWVYANLFDGGKLAYIEEGPLGTVYSGQSKSFNIWIWDSHNYDRYELEVTCWE